MQAQAAMPAAQGAFPVAPLQGLSGVMNPATPAGPVLNPRQGVQQPGQGAPVIDPALLAHYREQGFGDQEISEFTGTEIPIELPAAQEQREEPAPAMTDAPEKPGGRKSFGAVHIDGRGPVQIYTENGLVHFGEEEAQEPEEALASAERFGSQGEEAESGPC